MRAMEHPNLVTLKHCFYSTTSKEELFLNLVMEYVPETISRVLKHYNDLRQNMPLVYVKLYTYQVSLFFKGFFLLLFCFAGTDSECFFFLDI